MSKCIKCDSKALNNYNYCKEHYIESMESIYLDNTDINNLGVLKWCKYFFPEYMRNESPEFHIDIFWQALMLYNPIYSNKYERLLELICFRGGGKGHPLTEKILTEDGYKQLKDIQVGTIVYGDKGERKKITHLHPITNDAIYKVTTRDGRTVECDGDHLWKVYDNASTMRKYRILSTKELMQSYVYYRQDTRYTPARDRQDFRYFLDTPEPIQFNKKTLSIDPYLLGLAIGDGSFEKKTGYTRIHTADEFIVKECQSILKDNFACYTKGNMYRISCKDISKAIKKLGLNVNCYNKFIPYDYLNSDIEDRIALLQGLMDTDGTVDKRGTKFSYSTVSNKLANDFVYLVRSLGGTTTLSEKQTKCNGKVFKSYIISCRIQNIDIFRLPRKKILWKGSIKTKTAIVSIKFDRYDERRCITVEGNGLYIANDFTITHNSTVLNFLFTSYLVAHNGQIMKLKIEDKIYEVKIDEKFIVILSETATSATDFTQRIRDEFSSNIKLKYFYRMAIEDAIDDITGQWTRSAFKINKCFLFAVGTGQQIRGKVKGAYRPTLIIADDIYSQKNTITEEGRAKIKHWWNNEVMPGVDDMDGKAMVVGTIVHDDTILVELEKNNRWRTIKYYLMNFEKFQEFLKNHMNYNANTGKYSLKFCEIENELERISKQKEYYFKLQEDDSWQLAWKDRLNLYFIALKIEEASTNNNLSGLYQEYFHITISEEEKKFKKSYFQNVEGYHKYENGINYIKVPSLYGQEWINCNIEFGIDVAAGLTNSDDSVIAIVAITPDNRKFLLELKYGKFSFRDTLTEDSPSYLRYGKVCMDSAYIEKIGTLDEVFRKAIEYHPTKIKFGIGGEEFIYVEECRKLFWNNQVYIPILGIKQSTNKFERIKNNLLGSFETKHVFFLKEYPQLEYQLEFLGKADHDDLADGLSNSFISLMRPDKIIIKDNSNNTSDRYLESMLDNLGINISSLDNNKDWRFL